MSQEMFEQDAQYLWADMLDEARSKGQDDLIAWLERARPLSFDGAVMRLATKQKWAARNLTGRYREAVEALMAEITMEPVSLEVEVEGGAEMPTAGQGAENDTDVQPPAEPASVASAAQPATAAAAPLSAAALAGKMSSTGRPRIHSRILSGEVPMPSPVGQPTSAAPTAGGAHRFQSPVSTLVENPSATGVSNAPTSQPIPVLEEGIEQKDEVKAQSSTDFTFDTYVVGDSNQIAYRLAMNVAEQPDGSLFNPLFIWGPSGNGKTHLLLAIQSYIALHQPRVRVQYVSAQMFINQYVEEVQVRKLRGNDVLRSMRNVDVLLLDDIQLFKQKMESVTALFEIFNNFILAGNKQIVLAADRAPDYLDLDPRLTTRFSQGMVADIQAPTWEMKLSILKSLYERYRTRNGIGGARISDANFEVIAQHCPDNPRQMTGLVNSIMMRAEFDPNLLTPDGIRAYIDSQFNVAAEISLDKIIEAVTKEYGVSYEQITSRSRTKDIKEARQVYMWLANQLTDETYQSIGDVVGLNHATITHGIKVINEKRNADHGYARQLEDFKNRLCNESK